ncbi:MAG: hypothetical protein ACPLIG_03915 [Candidatus Bathyarchaeales archaeon]
MKKEYRAAIVILLIGISLLMITVIRTNSIPHRMSFGNEEGSSGWIMYPAFLLFPRDFSVDIKANNTVSVYILDEDAIRQWNTDRTLRATWSYEYIRQGVFNEHAYSRKVYAVLVYLPANTSTAIKITLTFSGLEKDLLFVSLAIIGIGVMTMVTLLFIKHLYKNLLQR